MLTTLQTASNYLGITDAAEIAILSILAENISSYIEGYCNRAFGKSNYQQVVECHGKLLMLDQYPILAASVDGVTVDSADILSMGALRGDWWGRYTVNYSAGYVLPGDATNDNPRTLPKDLEFACLELIAVAYNKRGSEHLKVEVVGPLRSEFLLDIPQQVQAILDRYRKPVMA